MRQFEKFRGRRVTIEKASKAKIKDYKTQARIHNPGKDKINIIVDEKTSYLSIKNEDEKMIGLIQVDEIDEKTAYIKICVPNQSWKERYGTEALHQFIKCCRERKLYSRMYFKRDNSIVEEYKKERPKALSKDFYIDINIA